MARSSRIVYHRTGPVEKLAHEGRSALCRTPDTSRRFCLDIPKDSLTIDIPLCSLWMCHFSLAVSLGAALLLPVSIVSNEVLLLYPTSFYIQWLNSSLIHGELAKPRQRAQDWGIGPQLGHGRIRSHVGRTRKCTVNLAK